jgi:hypothetical protein
MDNNKIVEELYVSNWILKQCFHIVKDAHKAEFYCSEITLKLLTFDKLVELYERNEHKPYIKRLIFNELTDPRKKILKYSIENTIEITDYEQYDETQDEEE